MGGALSLAFVIASIVGHSVPVRCEPLPPGFFGMTWFGVSPFGEVVATSIGLSPTVCALWDGLTPAVETPGDALGDENAGVALFVAVHEAEHYRYDDANEAPTECRALRDFGVATDLVAPSVGRFDLQAMELRELLWQGAALEDAAQPSYYHGATC